MNFEHLQVPSRWCWSHYVTNDYKCDACSARQREPSSLDLLGVLSTCRQVYSEARLIFFAANSFYFSSLEAVSTFAVTWLTVEQAASITTIALKHVLGHPCSASRIRKLNGDYHIRSVIATTKRLRALSSMVVVVRQDQFAVRYGLSSVAGENVFPRALVQGLLQLRACPIKFLKIVVHRNVGRYERKALQVVEGWALRLQDELNHGLCFDT
jgi:hypothetical protein